MDDPLASGYVNVLDMIGNDFPEFNFRPPSPSAISPSLENNETPLLEEHYFDTSQFINNDQRPEEKLPSRPLPPPVISVSHETDPVVPTEIAYFVEVSNTIVNASEGSNTIPLDFYNHSCLDDVPDDCIYGTDVSNTILNCTEKSVTIPLDNDSLILLEKLSDDCIDVIDVDDLGFMDFGDADYCDDSTGFSKTDLEAPVHATQICLSNPSHAALDPSYATPSSKPEEEANKDELCLDENSDGFDVIPKSDELTPIEPEPAVVWVQKAPPRKRGRKRVIKNPAKPDPATPPAKFRKVGNNRNARVRITNTKKSRKMKLEISPPSIPSHSGSCNSDAEKIAKREVHKNKERERRRKLKKRLEKLRKKVPSIQHIDNPTVPIILKAAAEYNSQLKKKDIELSKQKDEEMQRLREREAHLNMLLKQISSQIC